MKCSVKAGMANEPAVDGGGLVGRRVIDDDVDVEIIGHLAVDQVQEPLELSARWRAVRLAMTLPEATSKAA